jgi:hypothetical protein
MVTVTRKIERSLSWAGIKAFVESGCAAQEFAVGDEIAETLTTGEKITLVVAGINVYAEKQIVFSLKNCLKDAFHMNVNRTNEGGWAACDMRKYLNSKVFKTFPEDMRGIITSRTLHTGTKAYKDKLWLPSEFEVFGEDWCDRERSDNDAHLPYYKKAENRVKRLGMSGSAYGWWERSPSYGAATFFCCVSSSGGTGYGASSAYGVAPCFCI